MGDNLTDPEAQFQTGRDDIEAMLSKAEAFMKLNDFAEAGKIYAEAANLFPHDHRAWWGIVRAGTEDFTVSEKFIRIGADLPYRQERDNALKQVGGPESAELRLQYSAWYYKSMRRRTALESRERIPLEIKRLSEGLHQSRLELRDARSSILSECFKIIICLVFILAPAVLFIVIISAPDSYIGQLYLQSRVPAAAVIIPCCIIIGYMVHFLYISCLCISSEREEISTAKFDIKCAEARLAELTRALEFIERFLGK
jgi:tetratricopeptide (TPR) repeat protein